MQNRTRWPAAVTPSGKPTGDCSRRVCVGLSGSTAWVLDGASSSTKDERQQTLALVQALDQGIGAAARDGVTGPRELLRRGLQAASALPLNPPLPSSSCLVGHLSGTTLNYAVLGDVSLVVVGGRQLSLVQDIHAIEREQNYLQKVGTDGLMDELRLIRRKMNVEGGYWIGGNEVAAADHATVGSLRVEGCDLVLLATDGLARLIDVFGDVDWPTLLREAFESRTLATAVARLRQLEAAPGSMEEYPRAKVRDDAAGLLLQVPAALEGQSVSTTGNKLARFSASTRRAIKPLVQRPPKDGDAYQQSADILKGWPSLDGKDEHKLEYIKYLIAPASDDIKQVTVYMTVAFGGTALLLSGKLVERLLKSPMHVRVAMLLAVSLLATASLLFFRYVRRIHVTRMTLARCIPSLDTRRARELWAGEAGLSKHLRAYNVGLIALTSGLALEGLVLIWILV